MDLLMPMELDLESVDWTGSHPNVIIWKILNAARDGDLDEVNSIIQKYPRAVDAQFWYVPPLHFAVREGHLDVVRFLVEHGADLTNQTLYGGETFYQTAQDRGHTDVMNFLREAMQESMSSDGEIHPIHEAAKAGDVNEVRKLIETDAALVNHGDPLGRRPLHYAVENQDSKLIDLLLDHHAAIDAPGFSSDNRLGGYGFRPVTLALWHHPYWRQRNDYETAKKLLKHGSEYTITIAAALGDEDRVRQLLQSDKELANFEETGGKRPLSAAAERGHVNIVKALLDAGADPNLQEGPNCPRGYALWAATRFGHREIAEMLLEAGADPNANVESSGNPTESAIDKEMRTLCYQYGGKVGMTMLFHEGNIDSVVALLQNAPHVFTDIVAADGFTMCVSNSNGDMVRLLLNHGIRVPKQVTGCQTYLWQDLELTRLLLEHEMDPNLPNWQSIRPLHHLGRRGDIEGAKLFLEFGADASAIDEEYRTTPLGWGAKYGHVEFVKFLLDRFPDSRFVQPPEVPSWAYPVEWAKRRNHTEIVEQLSAPS